MSSNLIRRDRQGLSPNQQNAIKLAESDGRYEAFLDAVQYVADLANQTLDEAEIRHVIASLTLFEFTAEQIELAARKMKQSSELADLMKYQRRVTASVFVEFLRDWPGFMVKRDNWYTEEERDQVTQRYDLDPEGWAQARESFERFNGRVWRYFGPKRMDAA